MEEKIKELIAIGASVAGHCQPCLEHHLKTAVQLGISASEIQEAVSLGRSVEKGALSAMKHFSEAAVQKFTEPENQARQNRTLQIYDPALCCSSGVCGPSVDPALAAFAGTLKAIPTDTGITVERYNLGQQPQAFVDNPRVKELLTDSSVSLPFIFINEELVCNGRYPDRTELFSLLGLITGSADRYQDGPSSRNFTGIITELDNSCCSGSEGCC